MVSTNHNVGSLDDCVSGLANLQAQFLNGLVGDGRGDNNLGSDLNLNDAVGCTLGDLNNLASELVTCRSFMKPCLSLNKRTNALDTLHALSSA